MFFNYVFGAVAKDDLDVVANVFSYMAYCNILSLTVCQQFYMLLATSTAA